MNLQNQVRRLVQFAPGIHWIPPLVWMAAIIIVPHFLDSSLPTLRSTRDELIRNGIHVMEYSVLAILLQRALAANPGGTSSCDTATNSILDRRPYLIALLIAVLFGAFDEAQQGFLPNRQPSLFDLLADSLGALLALLIVSRSPMSHE